MICKNCGSKLKADDLYCLNCGMKVNDIKENGVEIVNEGGIVNSKFFNRKKKIIIPFIIILILILLGVYYVVTQQPKNIKMEVSELSEIINNDNEKSYARDTLIVHGFLQRNPYASNQYILYSKDDKSELVLFTYKNNFDENLGDGSEIVITGKIDEYDSTKNEVFEAEKVEVINKVQSVLDGGYTEDVIQNSEDYVNKKIKVTGYLVITNMSGAYITDESITKSIWLYGISNQELYDYQVNGSWITVMGTLINDGGNLALEVEDVEQDRNAQALNSEEISDGQYSVNEVIENPDRFIDEEISIVGSLPMDLVENHSGNYTQVIFDEKIENFIVLKGMKVDIGACKAIVKGVLSSDKNDLILNLTSFDYFE